MKAIWSKAPGQYHCDFCDRPLPEGVDCIVELHPTENWYRWFCDPQCHADAIHCDNEDPTAPVTAEDNAVAERWSLRQPSNVDSEVRR